jgi:hypothetical protein
MEIENLLIYTRKKKIGITSFGAVAKLKPNFVNSRYEIFERPYLQKFIDYLYKVY